jgi:hypothetical protein
MAIRCQSAHNRALLIGPHRQKHLHPVSIEELRESDMAKGEQKGNREAKKPKKEKIKTIAAAPSQKTAAWQPSFASGKKK